MTDGDDDDLTESTIDKLKWLKLPGMARALRDQLTRSRKENLTSLDVVSQLCDE